jgi:holo-[acyl-carrier protein] synthase
MVALIHHNAAPTAGGLGLGMDIVQVARLYDRLFCEPGLKEQIFTPGEIAYCESRPHSARHYAGRFAAKEACLKALGIGLHGGLTFKQIEIIHDSAGRPEVLLSDRIKAEAERKGLCSFRVSMSLDRKLAVAVVTAEQ